MVDTSEETRHEQAQFPRRRIGVEVFGQEDDGDRGEQEGCRSFIRQQAERQK
jgi:hypothetical protein